MSLLEISALRSALRASGRYGQPKIPNKSGRLAYGQLRQQSSINRMFSPFHNAVAEYCP